MSRYVTIEAEDGSMMNWPADNSEMGVLEWTLRYSKPTTQDLLVAASVVAAYRNLIDLPQKRRNKRCSQIKRASRLAGQPAPGSPPVG